MSEQKRYRLSVTSLLLASLMLPLAWLLFSAGIAEIVKSWGREEYSYGYMIPFITVFLIYQKKNQLEMLPFPGSWTGVIVMLSGIILYIFGSLGAVVVIQSYGFIIALMGIVMSYTGVQAFKLIAAPLAVLVFMVPLPGFLYQTLSSELQLISSQIGVWFIRLFDISVYLEGNVIDLGVYKLQVVEACSGLRYLFPLTALSFIAAYLFKVEAWKRSIVFLSSIPITVLMNSIRIGAIGVTVEYWGVEMAEGVLHDFEGWIVFMGCIAALIVEMIVLAWIGQDKRPFYEVFGLDMPTPTPRHVARQSRKIPITFLLSCFLMVLGAGAIQLTPERVDNVPSREPFAMFPMSLGAWRGNAAKMEQIYVDALNFDDYLMSDFTSDSSDSLINLYIGYYGVQRADKVPHSPRACLPSGGWAIANLADHELDGVSIGGVPLRVNRAVIQRGQYKQLVYYWFQQRNRVVTSEWMVKLYLLLDSIKDSRTDGALVRLVTLIQPGEDLEKGDIRLTEFAAAMAPVLPKYVPD